MLHLVDRAITGGGSCFLCLLFLSSTYYTSWKYSLLQWMQYNCLKQGHLDASALAPLVHKSPCLQIPCPQHSCLCPEFLSFCPTACIACSAFVHSASCSQLLSFLQRLLPTAGSCLRHILFPAPLIHSDPRPLLFLSTLLLVHRLSNKSILIHIAFCSQHLLSTMPHDCTRRTK